MFRLAEFEIMRRFIIKILAVALCIVVCFSVASCKKDEEEKVVIPEGYTQMTVGEGSGIITEGYGTQIDTHIYKAYNAMNEEELNEFYSRVKEINIQSIRTQVFPEWFERGNDNSDYNSFDYNS